VSNTDKGRRSKWKKGRPRKKRRLGKKRTQRKKKNKRRAGQSGEGRVRTCIKRKTSKRGNGSYRMGRKGIKQWVEGWVPH